MMGMLSLLYEGESRWLNIRARNIIARPLSTTSMPRSITGRLPSSTRQETTRRPATTQRLLAGMQVTRASTANRRAVTTPSTTAPDGSGSAGRTVRPALFGRTSRKICFRRSALKDGPPQPCTATHLRPFTPRFLCTGFGHSFIQTCGHRDGSQFEQLANHHTYLACRGRSTSPLSTLPSGLTVSVLDRCCQCWSGVLCRRLALR